MSTDLDKNTTRNSSEGLEVAPSNAPVAINPDHSSPEVAPSDDPIVKRLSHSDLEILQHQTSHTSNHAEASHADKSFQQDGKGRRICGLRKVTFWLLLTLAVVLIGVGIGGGVGGALAGRTSKARDGQTGSVEYAVQCMRHLRTY